MFAPQPLLPARTSINDALAASNGQQHERAYEVNGQSLLQLGNWVTANRAAVIGHQTWRWHKPFIGPGARVGTLANYPQALSVGRP